MICYQCDWCGRVEPAGRGNRPSRAFNPVIERPQDWRTFREPLGRGVYLQHHFCTLHCAARWVSHRQWRKCKKRPRAKAV